jgi:pyridoxamine 5'-phosphate oxidase
MKFTLQDFGELTVENHPIDQFSKWFTEAQKKSVVEPEAMVLASTSDSGIPSARVVLLKGVSKNGFTFFTNYQSRKGKEILAQQRVALVFYWQKLMRQIRIEGKAKKISKKESEIYFHTRPLGSQIGAWTSLQSHTLPDRDILEKRYREFELQFRNQTVPLPPHWGGYCVAPLRIEFWQGRPNRLHDRIVYEKGRGGLWKIFRLYP